MDDAVRGYIAAIEADRRPLFDRIHQLVLQVRPDVDAVLSYQMPTFVVGRYRLYVGVWKHGLSFYGWEPGRDAGFAARHPELITNKGTMKLGPDDVAGIPDDELRDFVRAVFDNRVWRPLPTPPR